MKADIPRWCGQKADSLNYVGSTNLFYNGSVFVKEGLGCMLTFAHLADTGADSERFCPLRPVLEIRCTSYGKSIRYLRPLRSFSSGNCRKK